MQAEAQEPAANSYEFQSDGVIQMLEELKNKFVDEKTNIEKTEMEAHHAYEMVALGLKHGIEANENEIEKKSKSKASHSSEATESQRQFDEVKASREEDQKYLE